MPGKFSVAVSKKSYRREQKEISVLGGKLLKILGKKRIGFEVYLISNREMKALNARFLGKNRPTNVLSFTADAGIVRPDLKKNTLFLGEIFLAPDYVRAKKESLGYLFTHGFLHLLGYTHSRKRDRMKMEKLEDRLSQKLKT